MAYTRLPYRVANMSLLVVSVTLLFASLADAATTRRSLTGATVDSTSQATTGTWQVNFQDGFVRCAYMTGIVDPKALARNARRNATQPGGQCNLCTFVIGSMKQKLTANASFVTPTGHTHYRLPHVHLAVDQTYGSFCQQDGSPTYVGCCMLVKELLDSARDSIVSGLRKDRKAESICYNAKYCLTDDAAEAKKDADEAAAAAAAAAKEADDEKLKEAQNVQAPPLVQ